MPLFYIECYTWLKWFKRENLLSQILNLTLPKCFYGSFVNRTQNSSQNCKLFWRLRLGRGSIVHPPSNRKGLRDIQHSMSMVPDTVSYLIHCDTFLQNATDTITKFDSYFITKCDKSLLQNASGFLLQNATVLLQNATVITNCDNFITKCDDFITKCDVYYKLRQYKCASGMTLENNLVDV